MGVWCPRQARWKPLSLSLSLSYIPVSKHSSSSSIMSSGALYSGEATTCNNGDVEHEGKSAKTPSSEASHHFGHKTLLQSDALFQYILETSVYPREPLPLRGLREMTATHPWRGIAIPADQGQFMMLLIKLLNAKNTIELGVYTGYSLLSTALALPEDGKVIAMDVNREYYELGIPFMRQAGVHHKIDFREGHGLTLLEQLLQDEKNLGFFDFIFVDADKDNYLNYHERVLKLVKVGGLIGYDNTLWNGSVASSDEVAYPKSINYYKPFILQFNKAIALDSRVDISMVPIGDGMTLCRRLE